MESDDLRQQIARLKQQITARKAYLDANPELKPETRKLVAANLAQKQRELVALVQQISNLARAGSRTPVTSNQPPGMVEASNSSFGNHATLAARDINTIGVYLAQTIYGPDVNEQRREQMVAYLKGLVRLKSILQLHGLAGKLDKGLGLPDVYVMLAISNSYQVLRGLTRAEHVAYQKQTITIPEDASADRCLPHTAIVRYDKSRGGRLAAFRASLVTDSIVHNQRLVVCGAPGSGKSTFLHHLAWILAKRGLDELDQRNTPPGWSEVQGAVDTNALLWLDQPDTPPDWSERTEQRWLPIMLSLRTLAGAIKREGDSVTTVSAALRTEMTTTYDLANPGDLLNHALSRDDKAILLFDGLDEVPLEATATSADRATTLLAVRDFARLYNRTRIVITCRVRAFTEEMSKKLGWPVATLAPWTGGQIRHFVRAWYPQLVEKGAITPDQAERYSTALLDAVFDPARPRLREMAQNPLMLTLMALVIASGGGELPRDRPALYEEMLRQLLGHWDVQREGQSLSQVIGDARIGSEQIRKVLDRLSYEAHRDALSQDGRGRIASRDLKVALSEYFESVKVAGAWEAAGRCIDYFEQRSGLLHPEDDGSMYAFAHLTLQEHCAGRHLLLHKAAIKLVMEHRADYVRWTEPIFLGVGVLMGEALGAGRIEQLLNALIHDCELDGTPKLTARWQRDLILAAELGADRDWDLLSAEINVPFIQSNLRTGLVALVRDKAQPLPAAERVRAAFLLGDLGDPRIPVTLAEWRTELAKIERGEEDGYFCRIPAGKYLIGSDDPNAPVDQRPAYLYTIDRDLWITRYPITNSQWQVWVDQGGPPSRYVDDANRNHPTQPVVGVDWYAAESGAEWLSTQLGVRLRLPKEVEWEAAAGGISQIDPLRKSNIWDTRGFIKFRYPWGLDWQDDCAATQENRETRGWRWSTPVGCFPAGASPVGAMDMAGNVWEWCHDEWQSYPNCFPSFYEPQYRVLRGGSYFKNKTSVLCTTRYKLAPHYGGNGFRLCVVPHAH